MREKWASKGSDQGRNKKAKLEEEEPAPAVYPSTNVKVQGGHVRMDRHHEELNQHLNWLLASLAPSTSPTLVSLLPMTVPYFVEL